MRQHALNAFYGVLDYAAYPAAMILSAPILLRTLGAEGYGLWAVMTAVISAGAILASGFGDANIKYLSERRRDDDEGALVRCVRSLLGINLALGFTIALMVVVAAHSAATRLVPHGGAMQRDCILCLQLAAVLLLLRAVESVCISTQRAFERYGAAVRVSIVSRVVSVLAGALLTRYIPRVSIVLLCAVFFSALATAIQLHHTRLLLVAQSLWPSWDAEALRSLFGFGMYSWVLSASGVAFAQLDRIVLGLWLGGASLAGYALCTQLAQPVNGLAASALHFVFPYLSNRSVTHTIADQRSAAWKAAGSNVLLVLLLAVSLQLCGGTILTLLGHGSTVSTSARSTFAPVLWTTALLGLSVTPTYVLYALGRVRTVVWFNTAGGVLCAILMFLFIPRWGMNGVIAARIPYALSAALLYIPMFRALQEEKIQPHLAPVFCEEV